MWEGWENSKTGSVVWIDDQETVHFRLKNKLFIRKEYNNWTAVVHIMFHIKDQMMHFAIYVSSWQLYLLLAALHHISNDADTVHLWKREMNAFFSYSHRDVISSVISVVSLVIFCCDRWDCELSIISFTADLFRDGTVLQGHEECV